MSLRAAINAKCKDCTYHPSNGGSWRQQIAVCTSVSCPLWPVRPAPKGVDVPRDPKVVSIDWIRTGHAEAIAALRRNTPKVANGEANSGPSADDLAHLAVTHRGGPQPGRGAIDNG
jgi:hypothetical protein